MEFFFEVLIGGLLAGVMYALVAIGFVLIYKASGVFNFAQGIMVVFAGLSYWHARGDDPGLTTETALVATTLLGGLAIREPAFAAGVGVVVT